MKKFASISVDCIHIGYKAPTRKNGKPILTVRTNEGELLRCDKIDLFNPGARERFATALGEKVEIDVEAVHRAVMQLAAELLADEAGADDEQEAADTDPLASTPSAVIEEALDMLRSPDLIDRVAQDVSTVGVAGESDLVVTLYLVGTSRLLKKPLASVVQGSSSSGKSYIIETTAQLIPPESQLNATQMTPKALAYMPPGSLKHRLVVGGERSRRQDKYTDDSTRYLRELLSSGKISTAVPKKTSDGNETEFITQEGPIAFIESTTRVQFFDEDANRMLLLNTDEGTLQTQRVLDASGRAHSTGCSRADRERVIAKHHAAQRMLKQVDVVIPFADRISRRFPPDRVEARRAFPKLLSMIQAVCLLHQFQRETDEQGRLIATEADYRIARQLLQGPLGRSLRGRVSDQAAHFLERLRQRIPADEVFRSNEAARGESNGERTFGSWLKELHEAGLITQVTRSRGRRAATWRLANDLEVSDTVLPTVEDLFERSDSAELALAT